ncbi:uncharacterized protein LOC132701057 isoform X2 [Cylas formicarius]|uniref:uncharacterized protein LOC132701057 isoform X2 n=1 Tax=Cylas formicarius TaxID=197179 RepID=UPI0029584F9B|nr:uncharacterized protein LOC132701057 isoform X2 [Cylas formicarius]
MRREKGQKYVLNKIVNCKGLDNDVIQWTNLTFERDRNTKEYTYSLRLNIIKEVSTKFSMEISIWKCDASGSVDNCEYIVKQFRQNGVCKILNQKNQVYTGFLEDFDKPLVCPIKPGEYVVRKGKFNPSFFKFLPVRTNILKAELKGFDGGQLISCANVQIRIMQSRKFG